MRSCYFRNGVTWAYTGFTVHFTFFLYSHSSRYIKWNYLSIKSPAKLFCSNLIFDLHKELFIPILEQHRRYIYALNASMDPASLAKWSDLNPLEKSKIPVKYKHIFLTSEELLRIYYEYISAFMFWNYEI